MKKSLSSFSLIFLKAVFLEMEEKKAKEDAKKLIGEQHLYKVDVPIRSDRTGKEYSVPIKDLLERVFPESGEESLNDADLPPLVNFAGEKIVFEDDEEMEDNKDRVYVRGEVLKDFSALLGDAVLSQPLDTSKKIDFTFISNIFEWGNLGKISETKERAVDPDFKRFEISLPNRLKHDYVVKSETSEPIAAFSVFYPAYYYGQIANAMTNGANPGWELLTKDWVKEGIENAIESCEKDKVPPYLSKIQTDKIIVGYYTGFLLGYYGNLTHRVESARLCFDQYSGVLVEIRVIAILKDEYLGHFIYGVLELLSDFKKFKEVSNSELEKAENAVQKEWEKMTDGKEQKDILNKYKELLRIEGDEEIESIERVSSKFGSVMTLDAPDEGISETKTKDEECKEMVQEAQSMKGEGEERKEESEDAVVKIDERRGEGLPYTVLD